MQQLARQYHTRAAAARCATRATAPRRQPRRARLQCRAAGAPGAPTPGQQQQQQQTVVILAPPPPPGAAAASAASPADALTPEQQQQWAGCVAQLVELGLSDADSERLVARAFGWGTQVGAAASWQP